MIRPIIHDPLFLAQKSEPATEANRQIITDLLDTLRASLDRCVGMAANMIGEIGGIRNRRRLSVPGRNAKNKTIPEDHRCLSGSDVS